MRGWGLTKRLCVYNQLKEERNANSEEEGEEGCEEDGEEDREEARQEDSQEAGEEGEEEISPRQAGFSLPASRRDSSARAVDCCVDVVGGRSGSVPRKSAGRGKVSSAIRVTPRMASFFSPPHQATQTLSPPPVARGSVANRTPVGPNAPHGRRETNVFPISRFRTRGGERERPSGPAVRSRSQRESSSGVRLPPADPPPWFAHAAIERDGGLGRESAPTRSHGSSPRSERPSPRAAPARVPERTARSPLVPPLCVCRSHLTATSDCLTLPVNGTLSQGRRQGGERADHRGRRVAAAPAAPAQPWLPPHRRRFTGVRPVHRNGNDAPPAPRTDTPRARVPGVRRRSSGDRRAGAPPGLCGSSRPRTRHRFAGTAVRLLGRVPPSGAIPAPFAPRLSRAVS